MKKILTLLISFCLCGVAVFGQITQKETITNPLDCAVYLIKKENKLDRRDSEILYIADLYWKLKQRKKALELINLSPEGSYKISILVRFARDLKQENNSEEAKKLYQKAFDLTKKDEGFSSIYKDAITVEIIKESVRYSYSDKVFNEVNKENSSIDNAYILLAIADGFIEKGETEKAVELIPQILQFAQTTEWKDLELLAKAKAGTIYLKAGQNKEAETLYQEVKASSQTIKERENIFVDDLWEEIFRGYKAIKNFNKAIETLTAYKQTNTLNSANFADKNLVETYFADDQKNKAFDLMNQILAEDEPYNSTWAAKIYLEVDDADSAKQLFLNETQDYSRQKIALEISKYYERLQKDDFASNVLNLAYIEAKKIKSDEPESGMMSSSPAKEKARYFSNIAQRFIDLKDFDSAEKIIQTIEKPFFKAKMLTILAEKQTSKNSSKLLNQALQIMRKTETSMLDAGKYQVWGEIAAAFAKVGNKEKSIEVFNEILAKDKEIYDAGMETYLLQTLGNIGFYYETTGLKNDARINKSLQSIVRNWEEDNY